MKGSVEEKLYSASKSEEERDRLVMEHLSLVKVIAERLSRMLPPVLDKEDMYEAGILGLLDAANRYDSSKNCSFKTFASIRIKGAILDEVRSLEVVPKSLRQRARKVEKVIADLERELGQPPSDEIVAERLGLTLDEYRRLLQSLEGVSFAYLEDIGSHVLDLYSYRNYEYGQEPPVENLYKEEIAEILSRAIDDLPERERLVITLYYYEGFTIREIGKVLGLAKSTVSEIHIKALMKLKSKLQELLGGERDG